MATTFTLFPNLPLELRQKIWFEALQLFPRIFEIRGQQGSFYFVEYLNANGDSKTIPPWSVTVNYASTLSQVNKESRTEFVLHSHTFHRIKSPVPYPNLRFCPTSDTLLINLETWRSAARGHTEMNEMLSDIFGPKVLTIKQQLRTLAGNERFWYNWIIPSNIAPLFEFPNLETVIHTTQWSHQLPQRSLHSRIMILDTPEPSLMAELAKSQDIRLFQAASVDLGFTFVHEYKVPHLTIGNMQG